MLWSVFTINSAIVTSLSSHVPLTEAAKKEKRGIYGFAAHGHHQHYAPYYDDVPTYPHHPSHLPSPPAIPPPPPHHGPVNLGAHFHTTVTKKIGVPIPYPYPVRVKCNFTKMRRHMLVISKFPTHEKLTLSVYHQTAAFVRMTLNSIPSEALKVHFY